MLATKPRTTVKASVQSLPMPCATVIFFQIQVGAIPYNL